MSNPLLEFDDLPPFSKIKPELMVPAIDQTLQENRKKIQSLLEQNRFDWNNLVFPLENLDDGLNRIWSPINHMNSVVNSDSIRQAYNACLPKLSEYSSELGQNSALYEAFKSISTSDGYDKLDIAQKKIIENALRDFELAGVSLPDDKKERYKQINTELSQLQSKFEENLLDATHGWSMHIEEKAQLEGLPETTMALLAQNAKEKNKSGWIITLDFPSYYPILTYASNRELRQKIYQAYVTRASDLGPNAGQWDNRPIMDKILALRHEQAKLLGYDHFAEKSLVKKMAATPEQVMDFLNDLARRSKPFAESDIKQLQTYAKETDGLDQLQAWDIAYYGEKLKQHKYAISQEELRTYFPVAQVLAGMFEIVERLFSIRIHEKNHIDTWHPDVRFFQISNSQDEIIGLFYLDLYARAKKRGGAWMDDCRVRKKYQDAIQIPVAYLTCNFTPPVDGKPSLLTHDEVQTLFHEFGHGLHHLLTKIDYPSVAGINGVPWDAVELPSQFLENWCWQKEALDIFAKHYETGESLPNETFEKMIRAKNFLSGMQMVRQLEFAIFDFRLHCEYSGEHGIDIDSLMDEVREQVAVVIPPAFNRFANGFSHIFAGGYAAGYYSYKWAEVLSSDAFSKFEENGIFDRQTGELFLNTILEQGGSKEPIELFKAFRGREPNTDALLRHSGLV